tara:strand:+ start:59350 stop:62343 length:2994 start_codon:yes stop_codon:yes gene_type:complete
MKNNYKPTLVVRVSLSIIVFFTVTIYPIAQVTNKLVSGTVTDIENNPLPGVNVLIKNKNRGTTTQVDGSWELLATSQDTLVFSFLGFKPVNKLVGNKTIINVQLYEDATALDQVVLNAGYYTVTNAEKTGSITKLTSSNIEDQVVDNPLGAMQGRMAGVNIVENSGVPGSGFSVRIRGQNSIFAGNEPLYIIDGVPYGSNTLSNINVSVEIFPRGDVSPLNAINPANIQSIEVLKDADATAIYGSRGANGVVLITTKKGVEGKVKFTINSSTGIAHITRKAKLLNTPEYLQMRREAFSNDGIMEYPETAYDVNGTWSQTRYTDWQEQLIGGTAHSQNIHASMAGGSEQTHFLVSGNYQKETTVFPGNFNYSRLNVNSNITHVSKDNRFRLQFNAGYTVQDNKLPKKDLTFDAIYLPPNAPALYNENGELNWENSTWTNPLAALQAVYNNNTNTLLSTAVLTYAPISNLEAKLNLGYNVTTIEEGYSNPHTIYDPAFGLDSSVSQLFQNTGKNDYFSVEPQLEWKKKFKNGELKILFGATHQKSTNGQQAFIGIGFPNNQFINNLSSATTLLGLNENEQVYSYQSFFSRINYSLKNKIYFNLTARRDGSSRFGPGNKYGNFGAMGAAWLFSKDLDWPWLNMGKVRGSYGITGNDQIGDYQYLQSYIIGDNTYNGNIALEPARLFNPNFKWEENRKAEIAIELELFKNSLLLAANYYRNRSGNQLINYTLPTTTGFSSILSNLDAVVQNTGWEVETTKIIVQNENFFWNTSINLTIPKNKLVKFPNLESSTYANRFVIGQPLSIAKLYNLKGVNPQTGLFEFEDYNGDGQITPIEDRQYIADLTPKLYGGLSNSIQYKNWGLDLLFQFVKKEGYNQFNTNIAPGTMFNQPIGVLNHWQQTGDTGDIQQFTTGANSGALLAYSQFSQSSGAVSDASFIRLKSLHLSYKVPISKSHVNSCMVSLKGQNLLTLTNYKGADPEQTRGYIPSLRRIVLGIQLQL